MTALDHEVCDAYLAYRQKGYSKSGSIYMVQRELVMSRAAVEGIIAAFIITVARE